jgi:RNA polymerase sigma factor FliA
VSSTATAPATRRFSQAEALALWRRYKTTSDSRLRDRLIMTYAPLVKYIVYRKIREVPSHLRTKLRERLQGHEEALTLMDA